MIKNVACKKCGSNKIIQGVKIIDYSHGNIKRNLSLETSKTKSFLSKKREKSEISTNICGNCGNIELYAVDYKKLWEIYNDEK